MNSSTEAKLLAEKDWPAQLWETPEPPEQLYIEGKLPDPEFIYLAVVGSRKFSSYGREACEKIIGELAGYPIAIVSGLALGIDTIAHQATLRHRLPTVAFPGSGLDRSVLHPHSNRRLADEIVAAGGALVSEFPPTYPAGLHTFPRRNRIMAGLAHAILIVEAGAQSGTLITARLALDYNREVLAVPGSIFSSNTIGTHSLIRNGAALAAESSDILTVLGFTTEKETRPLPLANLSPRERALVELIATEPLSRDEIINALALPVSEVNTLIATLEIQGIIVERGGEVHLA